MTSMAEQQPLIPTVDQPAPKAFPGIPAAVTGGCAVLGCVMSILLLTLPWATLVDGTGSMSLLSFTDGNGHTTSAGEFQEKWDAVVKQMGTKPRAAPFVNFYVWNGNGLPYGRICFVIVVICLALSCLSVPYLGWAVLHAKKAVAAGQREQILKASNAFQGTVFSFLHVPIMVTLVSAFTNWLIIVLVHFGNDSPLDYDIDGTGGFVMISLTGCLCMATCVSAGSLSKRLKALAPAQPAGQPQYAIIMAPGMQPQYGMAPGMQPQYAPARGMQPQYGPAPGMQPQYAPAPAMQPQYAPAPVMQPQYGPAPEM